MNLYWNTFNANEYLNEVVDFYNINRIKSEIERGKNAQVKIREILQGEYGKYLAKGGGIIYSGSIAKSTAVKIKYDFDLIVPFHHGAFKSLSAMYDHVYRTLSKKASEYGSSIKSVRKQRVSTGLTVSTGPFFEPAQIDVVPGKELGQGRYQSDRFLNLYDSKKQSSFQTNLERQIQQIRDSHANVRSIIQLLKVWKYCQNGVKVKSFMLEMAAIQAFNRNQAPRGIWPQLKMVMEFIRDNFSNPSFKLIDPGNSNNDVMDTLSQTQRVQIASTFKRMLAAIQISESELKTYFPKR